MNDQLAPDLSVVLTAYGDWDTISLTMNRLQAQTIANRLEVVIVTPSSADFGLERSVMSSFLSHRLVEHPDFSTLGGPRAAGIRQASAPIVAFIEDHSFPEPAWAESLLQGHREPWACVGPVVRNGNPGSLTSWADFYMTVFPWIEPATAGPMDSLPWHNSAYKRKLLLDLGTELEVLLDPECSLQWKLATLGHQFYLEPQAQVNHVSPSRLSSWLRMRFPSGRLYAAARAEHWPALKRLAYVLGAPLIPPVRLWRTLQAIGRSGRAARLMPGILPLLIAGLVLDALGQMAGYGLGMGNALQPYFDTEMRRAHYVNEQDKRLLKAV
jgi:hypothetical protein